MKNKLMLIGLTAILSVGLKADVETVSYTQRVKNGFSAAKDSSVNGSKAVYSAIASGATATKNGIVNGSIATKNGIVDGTCATGRAVKYAYNNPRLAKDIAWTATKDFSSNALTKAQETGKFINGKTFGNNLGYFKYDGAVVSTVVLAGLGYGTYKVYKNGYVSKMKQAIVAKFAKKAPVVVQVDETPVAVQAPVVARQVARFAPVAKVAPKKAVKRNRR